MQTPEDGVGVNVSHHITRMAFGTHKADEHPEIINPLDGEHHLDAASLDQSMQAGSAC